ncbi:MAG: hypothetical protein EHM41_25640 [Chloroflexi bacterium]|nr:MAG: hypothetical protein EHM41_25640 [Chloroflexota bacterium]
MSAQTIRLLIAGALVVHGIGHTMGFWLPVDSWLLNQMSEPARRMISSIFWILSTIGFLSAALGFWGIIPGDGWRVIAVVTSIISLTGLILFIGNWALTSTIGTIGLNILILVSLLWINWLPGVQPLNR